MRNIKNYFLSYLFFNILSSGLYNYAVAADKMQNLPKNAPQSIELVEFKYQPLQIASPERRNSHAIKDNKLFRSLSSISSVQSQDAPGQFFGQIANNQNATAIPLEQEPVQAIIKLLTPYRSKSSSAQAHSDNSYQPQDDQNPLNKSYTLPKSGTELGYLEPIAFEFKKCKSVANANKGRSVKKGPSLQQMSYEKKAYVKRATLPQNKNIGKQNNLQQQNGGRHLQQQLRIHSATLNNALHKRIDNFASSPPQELPHYQVWIEGSNAYYKDVSANGSKGHILDLGIGAEKVLNAQQIVGIAINKIHTSAKQSDGNSADSKNYILSLYSTLKKSNWLFSGAVAAGQGRVTSYANNNSVNFTQNLYAAQVAVAYDFKALQHCVIPSAALHYWHLRQGGHASTAVGGQYVGAANGKLLTSKMAVKYQYKHHIGNAIVVPGFELSLSADLMNKNTQYTTNIAPSNKGNAKKLSTLAVTPSISVKHKNCEHGISYTYAKAKNMTIHQLSIKIAANF